MQQCYNTRVVNVNQPCIKWSVPRFLIIMNEGAQNYTHFLSRTELVLLTNVYTQRQAYMSPPQNSGWFYDWFYACLYEKYTCMSIQLQNSPKNWNEDVNNKKKLFKVASCASLTMWAILHMHDFPFSLSGSSTLTIVYSAVVSGKKK